LTINPERQQFFMSRALAASKLALPHCLPNPPVGCVLVKNDQIVATGYTRQPGANHAEADALAQYPDSLALVSAFVTLEPCSFIGRTPSCAKALVAGNINTVYIAITDPDPRNNGLGSQLLRDAGITVYEGLLSLQVETFLAPYLSR